MSDDRQGVWSGGGAYEPYVGRWSRLVARPFLDWLGAPPGAAWLDCGCGTGALTETILSVCSPSRVHGIDPSEGYLRVARVKVQDPRAHFEQADAQDLHAEANGYDMVVSGLVLNFIPDKARVMRHLTRVAKPGGQVAAYVWDYAGRMELMRYFWDAAVELKPENRHLDEGVRFPLCQPDPLAQLFEESGLTHVEVSPLEIPTHFQNFDDYWTPFLGGQFPAPDYAMSLSEMDRAELRERIRSRLPMDKDGSIKLVARAWGVRGVVDTDA